ncbi:MAG: TIGR02680 family protein [Bulleidia sp.]|nr:TIGR02680 family protein [Bulleidia sp.]
MSERWKMNRMGFVNFWLYDDECFELEDGKMLLRGQNGSGKSITTQSFIPFILDGDRTPGRLDPFGSADRKMEYYFLMDGQKEESTGYLYLEFKKEGCDEYRTIGIGQKAHKGRPMGFWGFVIVDQHRIGIDLQLYQRSGDIRIPLEKTELKKLLGEQNPFTDEQGKYKALVNQYIFGFERMEQYEQFLSLLIKIRGSKLSNAFRPTRIYQILNDSLQVLSDEDLRPMVEAMERMDAIQEKLEGLIRSYNNAQVIAGEYDRYNQFMLIRKWQACKESEEAADAVEKDLNSMIAETDQKKQEVLEKRNEIARLEAELNAIARQIEEYLDPELENMDQRLVNAEKQVQTVNGRLSDKNGQIREKKEQILICERNEEQYISAKEYQEGKADEKIRELNDLNKTLQMDVHVKAVSDSYEDTSILLEIADMEKQISDTCHLLQVSHRKNEEWLKAQQEEHDHFQIVSAKTAVVEEKEERRDQMKDQLIEDLYSLRDNTYWSVEQKTIEDGKEIVMSYERSADSIPFDAVLSSDYQRVLHTYSYQQMQNETQLHGLNQKMDVLVDEYHQLEEVREVEPVRDDLTAASRQRLMELGIQAIPFYRTVKFADDVDEHRQAVIEASLLKAGLLDALVVTEQDRRTMEEKCPDLLDVTIRTGNDHHELTFTGLMVEDGLNEAMATEVARILSCFDHEFIVTDDGAFTHGLLQGRSDQNASLYIGATARMRAHQLALLEKQKQIDELAGEIRAVTAELDEIAAICKGMKEEWEKRPSVKELGQLCDTIFEDTLILNGLYERQKQLETASLAKKAEADQCLQSANKACSRFPYERTVGAYEDVLSDLKLYQRMFTSLSGFRREMEKYQSMIVQNAEMKEQAENDCDFMIREKQSLEAELSSLQETIATIQSYLTSDEMVEKAEKLQSFRHDQKEKENLLHHVQTRVSILEHDLEGSDDRISHLRKQMQIHDHDRVLCRQYMMEEVGLRLVFEEDITSVKQASMKISQLDASQFKDRTPAEMVQKLFDVYTRNNSDIVQYSPSFETVFTQPVETVEIRSAERSRQTVVAWWHGKKLSINDFARIVSQAVEETKALIEEKDRELFENILSQTVAQKLTARIDDSRKWVKDMSALMKKMKTSMDLHFSLSWTPIEKDESDELSISQLEKILNMDRELISSEDETKAARYFRNRIAKEKQKMMERNEAINYMELVRDVLDYRRWFEFRMSYWRNTGNRNELTNAAFNRFSGGEKAMAMYIPLFAALNAQYQKATDPWHPRILALDEAFAGVDDTNIASMFQLVEELDFDYIMNSQILWGCFETVRKLKICELLRPLNADHVTVINYIWDGHHRRLCD